MAQYEMLVHRNSELNSEISSVQAELHQFMTYLEQMPGAYTHRLDALDGKFLTQDRMLGLLSDRVDNFQKTLGIWSSKLLGCKGKWGL